MFVRALAAGVAMLLLPGAVQAQWSGFLRLDNVNGESRDTNHLNWIDVFATAPASIDNNPTTKGSRFPNGPGSEQPLSISKNLDAASPMLALLCAKGTKIYSGTLDLTTNSSVGPFLRLQMRNIYVSALSQNSGDTVSEDIQLQAEIYAWNYTQFNTNSGLPSYLNTTWNFATGTGFASTNGPLTMTTGMRMSNSVELSWNAVSGQSYRIFAVPNLGAPFTMVSMQTATNTGTMTFNLPAVNNAMFYVVEKLP